MPSYGHSSRGINVMVRIVQEHVLIRCQIKCYGQRKVPVISVCHKVVVRRLTALRVGVDMTRLLELHKTPTQNLRSLGPNRRVELKNGYVAPYDWAQEVRVLTRQFLLHFLLAFDITAVHTHLSSSASWAACAPVACMFLQSPACKFASGFLKTHFSTLLRLVFH